MKLILSYMKPHFRSMVVGFVIKFTGTIMDLFLPWILAYIIETVVPTKNIGNVWLWGLAMIGCAIIAVLGNIIANRMASAVARDSMRTLRNDVFTKITYLSCEQIDEFSESSLISRMTSDTYNIHHVMGMMQRLGVRAPILLMGGIGITMTLDPVLSSILVITLPFLAVVVIFVAKKGIPLYKLHQKASDGMIDKVRESVDGIRVIKALSKTGHEQEQFEHVNDQVVDREKKAGYTMAVTSPVMNFLLNMGWVAIILVGAIRVHAGLTQPGKIIAFLTYFTIILNAMLSITRLFVMYSKAGSSAARISQILEAEDGLAVESILEDVSNNDSGHDTMQDKADSASGKSAMPQAMESNDTDRYIEFDHVSFSYNGRVSNIKDMTFSIGRHQSLGIIGGTGCGKTTIISLLMRLYDVNGGSIRVDGVDVRNYEPEELHSLFGAVFQNDTIFEDTVSENIKLGREIDDEKMKDSARCVLIEQHILGLEDDYNSYLAIKGNNLSGGQKQRLLISRAVAGNPKILVLDDSSSALDYKTDAAIRKNIEESCKDATIIIIAQRVSSVMNCDHIIVVDNGQIIGAGNHEELLESCQEYRMISELQKA